MNWTDTLGKHYYSLNTGCPFERVSIKRGILFRVKCHCCGKFVVQHRIYGVCRILCHRDAHLGI